ncbi:FUSC family protein [Cellvibrio polysaccharolyticus]|uniref:FUSC family protein n=1 Tax=Cellvibrio polysaccharolyticus TaxID=2082724 RepID=A0A928YV07_9GAMM|nr:FUSC family protein [Cellvibrio polysaccharolyticus]MBE8718529.1 FUSC family protein [Cellvibrio polysaccharolyticus]
MSPSPLRKTRRVLREQWQQLITFNASDRRWQLPFTAALAAGLPMLIAAILGHIQFGLAASLGGMVFLHVSKTPLSHRMIRLMTCAFGMIACYAVGTFCQFVPLSIIPVITFTAVVVTMIVRYYDIGPPGSLFFVMAVSIGAYTPIPIERLPMMVGLLSLGCILAVFLAFCYSLYILRIEPANPAPVIQSPAYNYVIYDSVIIGGCVGASLLLAHLLQMERAYWVPISCVAVIQGASLQAVWSRQLQRVLGTALGIWLAFGLLSLPLNPISISFLIMLLTFLVEMLVVRHYGIAALFFTPLGLLLAEAATLSMGGDSSAIAEARFYDTLLGCAIGLLGGLLIYNQRCRHYLMPKLRRLIPARSMS